MHSSVLTSSFSARARRFCWTSPYLSASVSSSSSSSSVMPSFLWLRHKREYAHCNASAKNPPRLDKHISINGTPNNAYSIVRILPSGVFGVKLPWPGWIWWKARKLWNRIAAINVYGSSWRWRTLLTTYFIIDILLLLYAPKPMHTLAHTHKHWRPNRFQFTDQILTCGWAQNVEFISNRLTFNKSVKISCVSFHINQFIFFRFGSSNRPKHKSRTIRPIV